MRQIVVLFLTCMAILLSSCATSSIPLLKTSDDCLVLIATQVNNPESLNNARRYYFVFEDGSRTSRVSSEGNGFIAVFVREPGVRLTEIVSYVDMSEARGDSYTEGIDLVLPYQPGRLVLADFVFVQSLKRKNTRVIISNIDLVSATPESDEAALAQFKKKGDAAEEWLATLTDKNTGEE